jgi:hypothetical protein
MTGFDSKRAAAADKLQEREALKLALDALENAIAVRHGKDGTKFVNPLEPNAIAEIKAALVQPAQEPVAWAVQGCSKMWRGEFAEIDAKAEAKRIGGTCVAYALYTTPPQRPWVGLTAEEICAIYLQHHNQYDECKSPSWGYERAIEQALKEKNS